MRYSLLLASLVLTASACTHHYKIAAGRELPEDTTDHGVGALEGAGIGALTGAAAGAAVGFAVKTDGDLSPGIQAVIVGASGAAAGAVSGLVIGAIVGSHEVYEHESGAVPRISASVTPGGASATAAWSF